MVALQDLAVCILTKSSSQNNQGENEGQVYIQVE